MTEPDWTTRAGLTPLTDAVPASGTSRSRLTLCPWSYDDLEKVDTGGLSTHIARGRRQNRASTPAVLGRNSGPPGGVSAGENCPTQH